MAMKQTQTKLFDFSDAGLDFSPGSKNLFPDRFKKMLAIGYNIQTVSSVAVVGNQVTFTYGGAHGYAQDRVLKVDSGALASINGSEFWIDSVTTNTVTFTLDGAPSSVASGFTTRIASLGWSLEYENANIQVYKLKALDETDLYLRLCFQDILTARNTISPCVGVSFDNTTGDITDPLANEHKATINPNSGLRWDFTALANNIYNSYTYSQGYSVFGNAMVVGSLYHLLFLSHATSNNFTMRINGVLPLVTSIEAVQKAVLVGDENNASTSNAVSFNADYVRFKCGNYNLISQVTTASTALFDELQAGSSYLPSAIEDFNTSTAEPVPLYLGGQHIGYLLGIYRCKFGSDYSNGSVRTTLPQLNLDIDMSPFLLHLLGYNSGTSPNRTGANSVFYAIPIEEVKID